ncbi:MAG TPA: hypothetical protein VN456_09370 [Desulfosporosinus sp.]|nr:hypothetical protein [Desulfosporosinus sp.]
MQNRTGLPKGGFFVAKIEDKENIKKSKLKLIEGCNKYFGSAYKDIEACQSRLHEELKSLNDKKETLLELVQEASELGLNGEPKNGKPVLKGFL